MEIKYVDVESSRVISALVSLYAIVRCEKEPDPARESARKLSKELLRLLNKNCSCAASGLPDVKYIKVPISIAEQVFQDKDQNR